MLAELINNTHTTFFLFCFSFFAELVKRALHSHPHAVAVCCHQGAVSEILKKAVFGQLLRLCCCWSFSLAPTTENSHIQAFCLTSQHST